MKAVIKAKSGDILNVKNISSIKASVSMNMTEVDTKDFSLRYDHYLFIGDSIVAINKSDIEYVSFEN